MTYFPPSIIIIKNTTSRTDAMPGVREYYKENNSVFEENPNEEKIFHGICGEHYNDMPFSSSIQNYPKE